MRTRSTRAVLIPLHMAIWILYQRATKIFDKVIVAVSVNSGKKPLFTIEERVKMITDECHT